MTRRLDWEHIRENVRMMLDSERHRRGLDKPAVVPPGSAGPEPSAGGSSGPAPPLRVLKGGRE